MSAGPDILPGGHLTPGQEAVVPHAGDVALTGPAVTTVLVAIFGTWRVRILRAVVSVVVGVVAFGLLVLCLVC